MDNKSTNTYEELVYRQAWTVLGHALVDKDQLGEMALETAVALLQPTFAMMAVDSIANSKFPVSIDTTQQAEEFPDQIDDERKIH